MIAETLCRLALVFYREDWIELKERLSRLDGIDRSQARKELMATLFAALIAGEDRRFYEHCGIEFRSIARATIVSVATRKIQGGSTITQQLVRTVTMDYRKSIRRKLKECALAVLTDRQIDKDDQVLLYMSIAYFGWRMTGIRQACARMRLTLPLSIEAAAAVVARLRYPEPSEASSLRTRQIENRAAYIRRLVALQKDRPYD